MADSNKETNILMAVLCYFGILVIIPLLTGAKKDPFVKFHIKQGLVLLIAYIIASFLFRLPFIGWILSLILFVLFIMGVINAATGKQSKLPLIGALADQIKI